MKRQHLAIIFGFLWFAAATFFSGQCDAREIVRGQIVDAVRERIALSMGDKVTISVGRNQGLITGDIGRLVSHRTQGRLEIGRCVIEESRADSSICQIIESLREIGRGDFVLFDGVDYRDQTFFSPIIDFLDSSVKAYPTHEKVGILIHEVFDGKNNITQLSERVRSELLYLASQKKRIVALTTRDIPDTFYYPGEYGISAGQIKDLLRKRNLDILVTGSYIMNGNSMELSFQRIRREGDDIVIVFPVSAGNLHIQYADKIVLPYVKREKHPDSLCSVVYRPRQYVPPKEEKGAIIKDEAGTDPFKELSLKRVEFNIISPVEFKITVDGAPVRIAESGVGQITLARGPHRLRASFKRGYYSNEALLYASTHEFSGEALLELNKDKEVVVEVLVDPLPEKGEPIAFRVYRKSEKEKQVLKQIQRFESDKLIEAFIE